MGNRSEELGVKAPHARKHLRVATVILTIALMDLAQLARIGNDHLVAGCVCETAYPPGARSRFQYNAARSPADKMLAQCLNRCTDSPFGDDFTGLIKDAKLAVAITDVEAYSRTRDRDGFCLRVPKRLHGRSSLSSLHLECVK